MVIVPVVREVVSAALPLLEIVVVSIVNAAETVPILEIETTRARRLDDMKTLFSLFICCLIVTN